MVQIATNIMGLNAHRSLSVVSGKAERASEKLSSGMRINRAADDAAGLAISEKMKAQVRGLNQAIRNVGDGKSLIQTAEGGMSEISEMMRRQRELVIQAMNDTYTTVDRQMIREEIDQLTKEITNIANLTEFNGIKLLNVQGADAIIGYEQIDGHYIPQGPITVSPFDVYTTYVTQLPLADYSQMKMSNAEFIKDCGFDTSYVSSFVFYDGTGVSTYSFNLEQYLAGDDYDSGSGDYKDMSFAQFWKESLFVDPENDPDFDDKAEYLAQRVASAIQAGLQAESGDPSIIINGEYDNGSGIISFTVDSTSGDKGFSTGGCSGTISGNFGHEFIHLCCMRDPNNVIQLPSAEFPQDDLYIPSEIRPIYADENHLWIQAGANEEQGIWINRYDCRASSLGIDPIIIDPLEEAEGSLERLDCAVEIINSYRATAGSQQNRLEHTERNLGVTSVNLSDANSRIADTDMAKEMMEYTKANVLLQAGMSMLTQANQGLENILTLLQ